MNLDALVAQFPHIWHATYSGGWGSIRRGGIRPAGEFLAEAGRVDESTAVRAEPILVETPHGRVVLRNQVPNRKDPTPYLDGISVEEWWHLINARSYYFANERDLTKLVNSYLSQGIAQEVIKFFTRALLAPVVAHIEVTTVNAGVFPRERGPSRGRGTFVPLDDFDDDPRTIKEITVTRSLSVEESSVVKVMRHDRDAAPARIWPPVAR